MKKLAVNRATEMVLATVALAVLLAGQLVADEGARVFDVPKLDGIVIDGTADDWKEAGFHVDVMTSVDGWVRPVSNMDSRISIGWDERGLLVLAQILDQDFVENADTNQLYAGDSVELYLVDKRGGAEMIQAVIAPGMSAAQPELRCRLYDYRKNATLKANAPTITAARTKVPGGYILEALLPWANVGISAQPGVEAAVQIFVNDADAGARPLTLAWHPATGTFMNTQRANAIRLAEKASPTLPGVAHAFTLGSNYWFSVVTPPRLVGKDVTVTFQGRKVAEGKVSACSGRAGVCLNALLPPDCLNTHSFEVAIAGSALEPVGAADLEQERGESAFPLGCRMPTTFTGDKLPTAALADASAERLVGTFDMKVTCFNETFARVTTATGPGLYGAIVEVQPRLFQPPLHRFFTFSRPAGDAEAKPEPGTSYTNLWLHAMRRHQDSVFPYVADWHTNLWLHAMRRQAGLATTLKYWLELPQNADKDPARRWPLYVLLHGAGERGKTPQHFKGWAGFPRGVKPDTFIIAVPACPKDAYWSVAQLDDMISDLAARYPVDADRIYVAGHSMGGCGCWDMLAAFPGRFAGGVICGDGMATLDESAMERVKNTPVWIFHGAKDEAAPVAGARRMAAGLERINGRVRYTEYPEDDHGTILGKAFGQVEVYDWLLGQVRGKPGQPPATAQQTGSK